MSPTSGDGRSRRWDAHRAARREELVRAAARAIEIHGPDAHVDAIAAEAGVSKPVLYRYFTDKDDLLAATTRFVADQITTAILQALSEELETREVVAAAVDAFLTQVEEHQNLFRLTTRHHSRALDPGQVGAALADGKSAAAALFSRVLGDTLRAADVDTGGAEPWAHGLVGMGLAAAEWWLDRGTMSRQAVGDYLTTFVFHALDGISREQPGTHRPATLRLVPEDSTGEAPVS